MTEITCGNDKQIYFLILSQIPSPVSRFKTPFILSNVVCVFEKNSTLLYSRQLWDFISTAVGEINQLSESVKSSKDKTFELLKRPPDKR